MITTKAYLPDGNITGQKETILAVEENVENYYGLYFYNGRIIEGIRFPKEKTRPLTKPEKNKLWVATCLGAIFG